MGNEKISIKKYKHPRYNWRVYYRDVDGLRKSKPFKTEKDAKEFADNQKTEIGLHGKELANISNEERLAVVKFRSLGGGISLINLVSEYEAKLEKHSRFSSISVSEAIELFIDNQEDRKMSSDNIASYRNKLGLFADEFGEWKIVDVNQEVIEDFIYNLTKRIPVKGKGRGKWKRTKEPAMASTKNSVLARVSTFFKFAKVTLKACDVNPCEHVHKIKIKHGEAGIYTPVEVARLLEAYPERHLPAFAINCFAGVRMA